MSHLGVGRCRQCDPLPVTFVGCHISNGHPALTPNLKCEGNAREIAGEIAGEMRGKMRGKCGGNAGENAEEMRGKMRGEMRGKMRGTVQTERFIPGF